MINIFKFLVKAYRQPRQFMQLLAVKFRQIHKISVVVVLAMAISLTLGNLSSFNRIKDSISGAIQYLPQYHYQDGQLQLDDQAKPLYYQSDYFQLVIDDTISSDGNIDQLQLPAEKQNVIDNNTLLNLFLFKDQALAKVSGNLYRLDTRTGDYLSRANLVNYLGLLDQNPWLGLISQFVTYLVMAFVYYWLQIFIFTLLSASFNRRLSMAMTFKQRLKLTIAMTALPLLLLALVQIFIPGFMGSFLFAGISLFITLAQTLKDHTLYIRDMLLKYKSHEIANIEIENTDPGLDYMELPVEFEQEEKLKKLADKDEVLKKFMQMSEELRQQAEQNDKIKEEMDRQYQLSQDQNESPSQANRPLDDVDSEVNDRDLEDQTEGIETDPENTDKDGTEN
ncbi:TPA: DUF1189 family protein [Streptococcus suis]